MGFDDNWSTSKIRQRDPSDNWQETDAKQRVVSDRFAVVASRVILKEVEQVKPLSLMIFFIATFLTACTTPLHSVDLDELSSVQSHIFHVRSVNINCEEISNVIGGCSADCQQAILKSIPTADIMRILSDSYGIKIAQEDNLKISSYAIIKDTKEKQHIFKAAKISMGKLNISFHIEDLFFAGDDADNVRTCSFLQDSTTGDDAYYINVYYTIHQKANTNRVVLGYDLAVKYIGVEQLDIGNTYLGAAQTVRVIHSLIRHRDEIEAFDLDSYSNTAMDKIRETAVKIPSALERDIKAHL